MAPAKPLRPASANAKPKGLLAPLFGNVSTGRKELRPRGASRKVNGNVILPATIHDFGNGRDYKVDLGMSPSGESWKVTSIANMDKLAAETAAKVIREELAALMESMS